MLWPDEADWHMLQWPCHTDARCNRGSRLGGGAGREGAETGFTDRLDHPCPKDQKQATNRLNMKH